MLFHDPDLAKLDHMLFISLLENIWDTSEKVGSISIVSFSISGVLANLSSEYKFSCKK